MTCLKVGLSSPTFFDCSIRVHFDGNNNAVFFERLDYNSNRNGSGKEAF